MHIHRGENGFAVSNCCLHFLNLVHWFNIDFVLVLPSFSGNVPAALKRIFPMAKITRLGDWYLFLFYMLVQFSIIFFC